MKPRHSLLYFPAIEYVRNGISKAIQVHEKTPIVLDCRNVLEFDFTAARGLGGLQKELAARNIALLLLGPSEEVKIVLKGALQSNSSILEVENEIDLDQSLQGKLNSRFLN